MEYTSEILIERNLKQVVDLLKNPNSAMDWMPDLKSIENLKGEHGAAGSEMKLHFANSKKKYSMTETILENNFPKRYWARYNSGMVKNEISAHMESLDQNTTRYVIHTQFYLSFGMRAVAALMPGMFKEQSQKYLKALKTYAEKTIAQSR